MQIKKSSKKPKQILLILAPLVLVVGSVLFYIYSSHADKTAPEQNPPASQSSEKSPDEPNDSPSDEQNGQTQKDTTSLDTKDAKNSYVDTPIAEQPDKNASYPIENEHYKIEQVSSSYYRVSLYPIVNNPEYSSYDSQLKAYKNEVLDYLADRYGTTSNFKLDWSPDEAKNI